MAKNREPVKPDEPESSEEEETDASSDEESEPEPTPILTTPIPKPITYSTPTKKPESSDSETEVESDDEESDPEPEPIQVKPIQVKKPQLTPAKRSVEEEKSKKPELKKAKKADELEKKKKKSVEVKEAAADQVSESSKKNQFQRFWTEDDEIVILKGMIEYEEKNNAKIGANLDGFLDYIKKNLHSVEVSKDQLQNKIRRLKKKFANNKVKKVRNFSKPYEKEAYELSEKIWGSETGKEIVVSAVKSKSGKGNAVAENGVNGGEVEVSSGYGGKKKNVVVGGVGSFEFDSKVGKMLRMGEEMFEGEEEGKGSKEWRKLEKAEMELTLKQMDVMRAKMKLVLDNMVE